MEVAANILGLLGALLLVFPAFYGARIVYRASRLARNANLIPDVEIETRRVQAVDEILALQNKWNKPLALCLFGGMGLGILSYIMLLLKELT
ncbi:MAG: hypothetical protein HY243_09790 [Proteobacteria bacterium]|nr:hypothetical protein [Pseudomonadota bacterium]